MTERRLDSLKRFGDVQVPPQDASAAAARRERMIGRIGSTIRAEALAKEARAKRTRVIGAIAVAAGVLMAAGVAWRVGARGAARPVAAHKSPARVAAASGAVVVTHGGHADAVPPVADVALDPDDEVATAPDARARIVLDSGATVELVADTRVAVRAARGERIGISVGEIAVHVPKLGANESFRVETPDAEVTVHGTSFVVAVHDGKTHVTVSEGLVSVKNGAGEAMLHAGDAWPAPEAPAPSAAPAPPSSARTATAAPPRGRPDPSTLDDQNRLLQRALASRRQGDDARALVDLDLLLARYPSSPLAQEARVEKFRALERMGQHARAVGEARRYLADYPNGFAADEAKALALR